MTERLLLLLQQEGNFGVPHGVLSLAAPTVVADEWYIPVMVVILALGGAFVLYRT